MPVAASSVLPVAASSAIGRRKPPRVRARGFTLLEVILALAIFAGALAVLGEVVRLAVRNAEAARDITHMQLLCESKLAEITSGITPAEPAQGQALEIEGQDQNWVYSVETESVAEQGLLVVRVTVSQDLPAENRPLQVTLTRWVPDPNYNISEAPTAEQPASGQPSSTGTSSSMQGAP